MTKKEIALQPMRNLAMEFLYDRENLSSEELLDLIYGDELTIEEIASEFERALMDILFEKEG